MVIDSPDCCGRKRHPATTLTPEGVRLRQILLAATYEEERQRQEQRYVIMVVPVAGDGLDA